MKLVYGRRFRKQYEKLARRHRDGVDAAILAFSRDPVAPSLRNRPLKGKLSGCRSIDAGFDLRIVFREEGGYAVVLFVAVGSHSQLYE